MSAKIDCRDHSFTCASGGYCVEWDDGRQDAGCSPSDDTFEKDMPVPIAQGKRRLRHLRVVHMRRGAIRQLLGGAVADVPYDQDFLDLDLSDTTVVEALAALESQAVH